MLSNAILSITPSETFHIEDGMELTPEESKEAEQMKKDFELSRRDPIAHNALINRRRDEEARKLRQYVASFPQQPVTSTHPPHSTQPSRWDEPLIATGDMLLPPSTAPAGGPLLYASSVANSSAVVPPNLDQPQIGSLPDSNSKAGKGPSVPAPSQTRSSSVAPRRLSRTPEFTSHDLQKHIEETEKASPAAEQKPGHHTAKESPISGVSGHKIEMKGSKGKKGGRKRSVPADEELTRKKAKRAPAHTPNSAFSEEMRKTFDNLLRREAARPSESET